MNLTDMLVTVTTEHSEQPDASRPCRTMTAFPAETPVGMAYVPFQQWKNVYEASVALERGTIFEDLDKPFLGERPV